MLYECEVINSETNEKSPKYTKQEAVSDEFTSIVNQYVTI